MRTQDPLRTVSADGTLRIYYVGCNGPFFGSRGCAVGMASLPRDGFAGYQGGTVVTAPVRVSGGALIVSVDGCLSGVRVGIVGDKEFTIENCDPIKGEQIDKVVTWKGKADLSRFTNGAISLEIEIPVDAVAFAYRT